MYTTEYLKLVYVDQNSRLLVKCFRLPPLIDCVSRRAWCFHDSVFSATKLLLKVPSSSSLGIGLRAG